MKPPVSCVLVTRDRPAFFRQALRCFSSQDYPPKEGFLSTLVARLSRARRPDVLVAWCCFLVLIARARQLFFSAHGWSVGGTLCFRRSLWARRPFRDIYCSSDRCFIRDNQPRLVRVCAADQYLLVRHGTNTWRRIAGYGDAEDYFHLRPSRQTLIDIVGPLHAPFYRSFMTSGALAA